MYWILVSTCLSFAFCPDYRQISTQPCFCFTMPQVVGDESGNRAAEAELATRHLKSELEAAEVAWIFFFKKMYQKNDKGNKYSDHMSGKRLEAFWILYY